LKRGTGISSFGKDFHATRATLLCCNACYVAREKFQSEPASGRLIPDEGPAAFQWLKAVETHRYAYLQRTCFKRFSAMGRNVSFCFALRGFGGLVQKHLLRTLPQSPNLHALIPIR
jgi:hypothetical protein